MRKASNGNSAVRHAVSRAGDEDKDHLQDGRSTARKTVPKRMAGKVTLRLLTRDGEALAKTNDKVMKSTRT